MSHTKLNSWTPFGSPYTVAVDTQIVNNQLHHITGEMIVGTYKITEIESVLFNESDIKNKLCSMLVDEMMKTNHILFTKKISPAEQTCTYYARIFVTPNESTQTVRVLQKHNI